MTTFYRSTKLIVGYTQKGGGGELTPFFPSTIFRKVEDTGNDAAWIKLQRYKYGKFDDPSWVTNDEGITLLENYTPEFFYDEEDYTRTCVWDVWDFNEGDTIRPFFANADFVLALSRIQSEFNHKAEHGFGNARIDNRRKGILGLTETEWQVFRETPYGSGYETIDLWNPYAQASCAIWQMHDNAKTLAKLWRGQAGIGTSADPYQARYEELLRCRLVGVERAFKIQLRLKAGEGATNLRDFLLADAMHPDDAEALMTDRKQYMRLGREDDGRPLTLKAFHDNCVVELNEAFKQAFELIKKYVPESLPDVGGDAEWMKYAFSELGAGISEDTDSGRKRIAEYFTATGYPDGTANDKWCAAFVAWCMDQSGGDVKESYQHFRDTSAAAASWRSWGNSIINLKDEPPNGAVVVKATSKGTDSISHVGFFREFRDGKRKIYLLGGNQSNAVTEEDYNSDEIVDIRWLNTRNASKSADPVHSHLLDLIAEPESNGNYDAYSGHTDNNDNPRLTAMSVAAVREWQKDWRNRSRMHSSAVGRYQIIQDTMDTLIAQISEASKPGQLFDEPMQDLMALTLIGKARLNKLSIEKEKYIVQFGNALARIWAGLPVLADTKNRGRPIERGESYYKGVGNNAPGITADDFEARLNKIVATHL